MRMYNSSPPSSHSSSAHLYGRYNEKYFECQKLIKFLEKVSGIAGCFYTIPELSTVLLGNNFFDAEKNLEASKQVASKWAKQWG